MSSSRAKGLNISSTDSKRVSYVRYEVFKSDVVEDSSLLGFQGQAVQGKWTLRVETLRCYETSYTVYHSTRHNIPDDLNLRPQSRHFIPSVCHSLVLLSAYAVYSKHTWRSSYVCQQRSVCYPSADFVVKYSL